MLSGLSRLLFVLDDGSNPAGSPGGSPRPRTRGGRIMEPAPPTYEEALTLFVRPRDAGPGASGGGGGMRALEGPPGRTPSLADDYEMAERLQQEELERCTVTRERSASLTSASSDGRNGSVRSETNRRRSAPGDFTPTYRNPVYDQTLRTIPESKQIVMHLHCSIHKHSPVLCWSSLYILTAVVVPICSCAAQVAA